LAGNFLDLIFVARALADEPTDPRQFQDVINDTIPQLRRSRTTAEVSSILTRHLPDNNPFIDVPTFGMRGTNYRRAKYLLARLTAHVESRCKVDVGAEHYLDSLPVANRARVRQRRDPRPSHLSLTASTAGSTAPAALLGHRKLQRRTIRREDRLLLTSQRLAAILDPKNQRRNPSVRNSVTKNGLGTLFHSFGDHPEMMVVVESRGLLYQERCRQAWSAEPVGLPVHERCLG
jgi:hypothetical protein